MMRAIEIQELAVSNVLCPDWVDDKVLERERRKKKENVSDFPDINAFWHLKVTDVT